ncbi:MAG: hypothetical protein GY782_05600 [Gammaproteobacteria bacterium]|nr:hypothetical protein [Gammaproteobacteria bacterium]
MHSITVNNAISASADNFVFKNVFMNFHRAIQGITPANANENHSSPKARNRGGFLSGLASVSSVSDYAGSSSASAFSSLSNYKSWGQAFEDIEDIELDDKITMLFKQSQSFFNRINAKAYKYNKVLNVYGNPFDEAIKLHFSIKWDENKQKLLENAKQNNKEITETLRKIVMQFNKNKRPDAEQDALIGKLRALKKNYDQIILALEMQVKCTDEQELSQNSDNVLLPNNLNNNPIQRANNRISKAQDNITLYSDGYLKSKKHTVESSKVVYVDKAVKEIIETCDETRDCVRDLAVNIGQKASSHNNDTSNKKNDENIENNSMVKYIQDQAPLRVKKKLTDHFAGQKASLYTRWAMKETNTVKFANRELVKDCWTAIKHRYYNFINTFKGRNSAEPTVNEIKRSQYKSDYLASANPLCDKIRHFDTLRQVDSLFEKPDKIEQSVKNKVAKAVRECESAMLQASKKYVNERRWYGTDCSKKEFKTSVDNALKSCFQILESDLGGTDKKNIFTRLTNYAANTEAANRSNNFMLLGGMGKHPRLQANTSV